MRALLALQKWMFRPVDIAGLVALRVLFGALMAWDSARHVVHGWVDSSYLEPQVLFKYMGFMWVGVLPRPLMYAVFGIMVASGICITIGLYYRVSCALFFVTHSYIFLVAASQYLNHAYLISVFTLLLMFVPANRAASLDALRDPQLHSRTIPAWPLWLLRCTFVIVFFYGGVAKINPDWLAGEPVRHWLAHRATTSVISDILRSEVTVYFVCYAGLTYDLFVGFALLWRRTRVLAVIASACFHLTNFYLFNIGVFPWFMLAGTTLFFEPSWVTKFLPQLTPYLNNEWGKPSEDDSDDSSDEGKERVGEGDDETVSESASDNAGGEQPSDIETPSWTVSASAQRRITLAVCGALLVQALIPLRHHLYPGYVAWTEEGHYFSWRMKLRHKSGRASFRINAPKSGATWRVDPRGQLSDRQVRKIPGRPDLMLQYAHYLRDTFQREYGEEVEVRGDVFLSLNYRAEQRYIDPDVDLGKQEHTLGHSDWILPFKDTPLPSNLITLRPVLGMPAMRMANQARVRSLRRRLNPGAAGSAKRVNPLRLPRLPQRPALTPPPR